MKLLYLDQNQWDKLEKVHFGIKEISYLKDLIVLIIGKFGIRRIIQIIQKNIAINLENVIKQLEINHFVVNVNGVKYFPLLNKFNCRFSKLHKRNKYIFLLKLFFISLYLSANHFCEFYTLHNFHCKIYPFFVMIEKLNWPNGKTFIKALTCSEKSFLTLIIVPTKKGN